MKVSFIILNWHAEAETIACVKSVLAMAGDYTKQIIVVDNESTDAGFAQLATMQDVEIVRNAKNLGFAGGVNSGLAVADGIYTALLNNDMVVHEQWLQATAAIIQDTPEVVAVGGKEFFWDDTNPRGNEANRYMSAPVIDTSKGFAMGTARDLPQQKVACLMGGNMLLDTVTFKRLNGLDEDFFAYYEETDLCMRLLACGKSLIYTPDAKVWHERNVSTSGIPYFRLYLSARNRLTLIAKNFPDRTWKTIIFKTMADYALTACLGKRGGLRTLRTSNNSNLLAVERKALLRAAIWGLTHFKWLIRKRKANIAAGTYSNNTVSVIDALQRRLSR